MNRSRGYTLLELMMVVALIGFSMAIALPTLSTAMAEQKQSEGALQVVSVFRSARAMAIRRGTPTVVSFQGAGQFWIIPAVRQPGVVASCSSVNWPGQPVPAGSELDFAAGTGPFGERFSWNRFGVNATFNVAPLPAAICYSPLGRVYLSVNGLVGPFTDLQGAAPGGAVVITVGRAFGRARRVIVPLGSGMPRLGT